jgi:hypothetical protein
LTTLVFATLTSAKAPQPSQTTQQPPQSGVATLRAGTQLVVVDVVVTDKNQVVSVVSEEGGAAGSMDKADRTDGAERAETTLHAPIRVNSRRLGFM